MIIEKIKLLLISALALLKKFDTVLISIVILLLFGFALLQINDAIDPTPSTEALNQAHLEQTTTQVRYDQKAIDKIKELVNIESDVKPVDDKDKHQENPFEP